MSCPKCSIIIPTYNERDNIPIVIWLIEDACNKADISYEIIVVDDASPDGTQEAVKQMQQLLGADRIILQTRDSKLGLGTAYRYGLQYASGSWVILMDADLSHHPKYIPQFFKVQQQTSADIVTGTRYTQGAGVSGWNWRRKLTSRGANVLASTILGLKVSDLTGAFRLYRRSLLEKLLPVVTSTGYAFQMEMIARATSMKSRIAEVPIVFVDRVFGESKLGCSEYVMFIQGLVRLFFSL